MRRSLTILAGAALALTPLLLAAPDCTDGGKKYSEGARVMGSSGKCRVCDGGQFTVEAPCTFCKTPPVSTPAGGVTSAKPGNCLYRNNETDNGKHDLHDGVCQVCLDGAWYDCSCKNCP